MAKTLTPFAPVPWHPALYCAQKANLRCTAITLRDGSLCLYSPVLGLTDAVKQSLEGIGKVSFLLAPNHYHHKGLKEYARAFPDAVIVSSDVARPRLEKQTDLYFAPLAPLLERAPEGMSLSQPEGLKTGEVWCELTHLEERLWVVCDAFKGPEAAAGAISETIGLLGTFPKFGLGDKPVYRNWLDTRLGDGAPTALVPCHGGLVASRSLDTDMRALLA